jgi:hypothetical protein
MIKKIEKLFKSIKENLVVNEYIPEESKISLEIVKKLILDPKSSLTITPISNWRYVRNEDKKVFVTIYMNTINIVRKNYNIITHIGCDKEYRSVCDLFNKTAELKRKEIEFEVNKNVRDSLYDLLNSM